MQDELKDKPSDDFISLAALKKSISNVIQALFKVFGFLLKIIRNNILLIIIITVVGIGLGFLFYCMKPKVYEQSMIVKFDELTRPTYFEIFSQLNDLATTKSSKTLAEVLKINLNIAKKIKSIELRSINGQLPEKDTSKLLEQPFKITLASYDNNYSDTLQNAIVSFVNDNAYLSKIKEDQKRIYLDKLKFIDKELQKLDSLKDQYTRSLNVGNLTATFYNNAFNPTEAYVHSLNLINQKEIIQKWLSEDTLPMVLIDGFKKSDVAKSNHLIKILGIGFLISFLFSFLISSLIEIKSII